MPPSFRPLEAALLLSSPLPEALDAPAAHAELARLVLDAEFESALSHPLARDVLRLAPVKEGETDANGALAELDVAARLLPSSQSESAAADGVEAELARLLVAVALLQAFVQINYTGPALPSSLSALALFPADSFSSEVTAADVDQLSIERLSFLGEPAYHLAAQPSFLQLAVALLSPPAAGWSASAVESGAWWALRAERVWHRLLMTDSPLPLREGVLEAAEQLLERPFLDLTEAGSSAVRSTMQDLRAALSVEVGLAKHLLLGEDKPALAAFERATEESELRYELTGALGKRTKWQQKEASQLVVLAKSRARPGWTPVITNAPERALQEDGTKATVDQNGIPETLRLNDDTLLEQTAYTALPPHADTASDSLLHEIDPRDPPVLHPLDQALILALPLVHHSAHAAASSELSISQLAPYTALALTHAQNWSIHTYGLLLRSRAEAGRTRTVERSVMQLQALVDQIPLNDTASSPGIAPVKERLRYLWQIDLPSKWELEAELAERLVSLGVFRSAEEIYRRLEMWDMVVRCYQHLEEQDRAIEIVTSLLAGKLTEATLTVENMRKGEAARSEKAKVRMSVARRANLLCMLGDMTEDTGDDGGKRAKYEQAWEESKHTSSRAARSLAGYHFARDNYTGAIPFFEAALAINPLFARSWFILGCAYVKQESWPDAVRAFRRCTNIEEEDAEAWNNLASCYLRMPDVGGIDGLKKVAAGIDLDDEEVVEETTEKKEVKKPDEGRIPHANKMLAFRALQIGLKYSFQNWRMWSNYAMVAVDLGENTEACRALTRVVEERADADGEGCIDIEVLDRLVASVTRAPSPGSAEEKALEEQQEQDGVQVAFTSNHGKGLETYVTRLLEQTILPRISSSARIYKAHAKLLLWRGCVADALDAHVKAYRASVINDDEVERERVRWREAVEEVQEVVDMLIGLGPRAVDDEQARLKAATPADGEETKLVWKDWKFQARSIVRSFMGRTKDAFEDEPEFDRLKEALDEIKNA